MNTHTALSPAKVRQGALVFAVVALMLPPLISLARPGFPFTTDAPDGDFPLPPSAMMDDMPPPPPGPHPALMLLDANEDGVLSAEEIAAAPQVLLAMDADRDGEVDEDELAAALPPSPPPPGDPMGELFAHHPAPHE